MKISMVIAKLQRMQELKGDLELKPTWEGQVLSLNDRCFGYGKSYSRGKEDYELVFLLDCEEGASLSDGERLEV